MRSLLNLTLLALALVTGAHALAAGANVFDTAERLALWGYDIQAWELLRARPPPAGATGTALMPRQRVQLQYVRARFDIANLVEQRDQVEFAKWVDEQKNGSSGEIREALNAGRLKLSATAATARASCRELQRIAQAVRAPDTAAWVVRALAGEAMIALVLDELPAARHLMQKALAIPHVDSIMERALIHLTVATIAFKEHDALLRGKEIAAGLVFLQARGAQAEPYYASLLYEKVSLLIEGKQLDAAFDAIGEYSRAQRAGPGGSLQVWREFGIADLMYQTGHIEDAERVLKGAIEGQLDAADDTTSARLDQVRKMVEEGERASHPESRVRVARLLLTDHVRERFGGFPEYRRLVDKYAMVAAQGGDIATMSAVGVLRNGGGALSVANDEQTRAALVLVEQTDPRNLLASLKEKKAISDTVGENYFRDTFVLGAALRKLRDALGVGAPEVEAVVKLLVQVHESAARNDLANLQLLTYRADVFDEAAGVDTSRRSEILDGIARALRGLGDPKSADDTAELSELEALRGYAKNCRGERDPALRIVVCKLYARELRKVNRVEQTVDLWLRLHDETGAKGEAGWLRAHHVSEVTDALYDALQYTELAARRGAFFHFDGSTRRVRIGQLCAALLATQSLSRSGGYCTTRILDGQRSDNSVKSVAQEHARLVRQAAQSGEITLPATLATQPRAAIASLQMLAKNTSLALDSRRYALLLAWETHARLEPRNESTESELLLDLAALYPVEDGEALVLAFAEQAFEINQQGGGTTPAFLRRVLTLLVARDPGEPRAAALIDRIVAASARMTDHTGSLTTPEVASVEFIAASNLPPAQSLPVLERLGQRLGNDAAFLAMESSAIRLDIFVDALLRAARTPAHAPRGYALLRTLLRQQDRLKVHNPQARSTVLLAAVETAQAVGARTDLPELMRALEATRHAGDEASTPAARILAAWEHAAGAARALPEHQAALSRLTDTTRPDEVYRVYGQAVINAMNARQFGQAERLLNGMLERALHARMRDGALVGLNPLREARLGYVPPCQVAHESVSTVQALLPGTLQECAAAMASWQRNAALYDTFDAIATKASGMSSPITGSARSDFDEFLAWEAALARQDPAQNRVRAARTLSVVDFVRSPEAFPAGRTDEGRVALLRIRAILSGSDGAGSSAAGKLQNDEAVVVFHLTKTTLFSWIVRRQGVSFRQWDANRAELRATISNARRQFYIGAGATELPAVKMGPLSSLYRQLLKPLETALHGVTQLYVVSNGALALVPYGVLVTTDPAAESWQPAAAWRPDWLIQRMGVGVLRSLSDFRTQARARPAASDKLFLGMGDPVGAGWDEALRVGAPCIASMPALESAAGELAQAAALFGQGASDVLPRDQFTLGRIAATDWSRYRYVLIASHAVQGDSGGCASEAGIVTSIEASSAVPPLLTASAVAQWRLAADLVVLSACESGVDDLYKEDRPVGSLATAFLDAGARSVAASNWPMVSAHAQTITTSLFRSLAAINGGDAARALHQSMLALSASPDRQLAHPLVWGALFLVGSQ